MNRRQLPFKLSSDFAVAAASQVLSGNDPEIGRRLSWVIEQPGRLDSVTLSHTEEILLRCRRQGDMLGPRAALQTVLAQRDLMAAVLPETPQQHRPRALSIYAELSQLAGWLLFNLGDYRGADLFYDDGRTVAHEAENVELVTYVLCTMSQLATWRGQPRVGIDHAIAAQAWASQSGNAWAQAYAADVAARAYADDGQADLGAKALEAEHQALTSADRRMAGSWWYFLDESFFWGTKGDCALRLAAPDDALEAVSTSLNLIDATHVHNYAFTLLLRGEAFIQQGEIEAATQTLADAVALAGTGSSTRFYKRIGELRNALEPWQAMLAVQAFDEQLKSYRRGTSDKT